MSRSFAPSQRAFVVALVVTAALALLPAAWLRRVTNDVAAVVSVPLTPFAHAGNVLVSWSHRARPRAGDPADAELLAQIDQLRAELRRAQLETQRLQERIAQLQRVPDRARRAATREITAAITGRGGAASTLVELRGGRRDGVARPAVAVYNGVHLVGRIVEVERLRSFLQPIDDPAVGPMLAAILPRDRPELSIASVTPVLVEPAGQGAFVAEVDATLDVAERDEVFLVDRAWPRVAQAMQLGVVESVRTKDQAPLRDVVVIRPVYPVHRIASVVVLVEGAEDDDDGEATP